jgi:hypothetical protein
MVVELGEQCLRLALRCSESVATMNLRRNLFRLWLVGSALFMLAVAIVSYSEIKKEFQDAATGPASVTDRAAFGTLEPVTDPALIGKRTPSPWTSLGAAAGIAFGFPLVALALGRHRHHVAV